MKRFSMTARLVFAAAAVAALTLSPLAAQVQTARGVVFHDVGETGAFDPARDKPLEGVAVSNGRDIVVTCAEGRYELAVEGRHTPIFVIKPRGWRTPVDANNIPRFAYIHSPEGASGTRYEGLAATGPLPESIDFALYPQDEPDAYRALFFADTQPWNIQQVHHLANGVLPELAGTNAVFGVTLGDLVFDQLNLFEPLAEVVGTVGIPWHHIVGNHDIDFTANNDIDARGAYYRVFGPSYYAFTWGPVHYIVLDNVRWDEAFFVEGERRRYFTGLGENQMAFLRNELQRVGKEQRVALLAHIPWVGSNAWAEADERAAFLELLAEYPNTFSLVGHRHIHTHVFIGDNRHHMVITGTVSGAWWRGQPDEFGVPHAMMDDGTAAGYAFLHVDGGQWKLRWKASRRPDDLQMHIHAANAVASDSAADARITANIYNALPDANVRMRVGDGPWIAMERTAMPDPLRSVILQREARIENAPWNKLHDRQRNSTHIWQAGIGRDLEPGTHVVHVRSEDRWWTHEGRRVIRVTAPAPEAEAEPED